MQGKLRGKSPEDLRSGPSLDSLPASRCRGKIEAANNVNKASKNINELNETFKTRRSSITNQINAISSSVNAIDDLARQDYESLKNMARLPDVSMQGLANLLVGKQLLDEVNY